MKYDFPPDVPVSILDVAAGGGHTDAELPSSDAMQAALCAVANYPKIQAPSLALQIKLIANDNSNENMG